MTRRIAGAAVLALIFSPMAAWCQGTKAPDYTRFVVEAKAEIARGFKDPASVQYRDLFISVTPNPAEDNKPRTALCGQINAKNSYGGYVGFQRFIVFQMPGGPYERVTGDMVDLFWGATCAQTVTKRL